MARDRLCSLFACFVDQPGNAARPHHQDKDDEEELGHQNKLAPPEFIGQRLDETEKDGRDHCPLHRAKPAAQRDRYALMSGVSPEKGAI